MIKIRLRLTKLMNLAWTKLSWSISEKTTNYSFLIKIRLSDRLTNYTRYMRMKNEFTLYSN